MTIVIPKSPETHSRKIKGAYSHFFNHDRKNGGNGTWVCFHMKRSNFLSTGGMCKCLRVNDLLHLLSDNDWVWSKINFLLGPQELPLATVERWKHARFGHVTRHNSLSKTIIQGTLEGWQHCGQQRKCWMDCPCQNCSKGPSAEKSGRGSLVNCPSCPSDNPIGQGTELY